jgi:3-oxoacyl-[acyl-carrier protein] reductase
MVHMDLQLNGKVALVTGGSRGLGRAICLGLAAEGAQVAVNYRSGAELADEVVAEIQHTHGVKAMSVYGDVSQEDDVLEIFRRVEERFSPIDVLVNNAGVWLTDTVPDTTAADWDQTFAVNLKGAFLTCREATRRWLANERVGRVVNIASSAAFLGATTNHAHYAASKAGLVNFTVSLAREMAPHGIHANAIAAGMMRTDMTSGALKINEEKYLDRIPLRRIADPAEVANLVVFLASERASYMTGATVDVSGGLLMR